jgi:lysophospholipase L1-like esterase
MELRGKKIAFLGDSITEGYGASCMEKTYWGLIGQQTGALVYGYGIGGTRIAAQQIPTPPPDAHKDQYFASRVESLIPDADVVVVFGGTNDFGDGDAALGHMEDRTEDTFYGAYHLLIRKLLNRYPDGKLVVMTPLHRMSEDETDYNERGVRRVGSLQRYADAIIEVAGFYGVPVVDLFRTSGIQPRVDILREKYMPDGLHPNDEGHALLAQRLLTVLNAI